MRLSSTSAFATLASTASAISAPSRPFLLLSTHKSTTPLSIPQYAAQAEVVNTIKPYLSNCPTHQYLIVNQAGLHSLDIYREDTIPNLRRHAQDDKWSDRVDVGEVHDGPIDGDALATLIRSSCPDARVDTRYLRSLGADDSRDAVLADNDLIFAEFLTTMSSTDSLTLIYYGGAVDSDLEAASSKYQYVAEFPDDGSQIELKRRLSDNHPSVSSRNVDDEDWPAPPDTTQWTWFQTHSWLSEAQTVIIITLVIFVLIMLGAMACVTSIQIPYGSFEADYVASANVVDKKKAH